MSSEIRCQVKFGVRVESGVKSEIRCQIIFITPKKDDLTPIFHDTNFPLKKMIAG